MPPRANYFHFRWEKLPTRARYRTSVTKSAVNKTSRDKPLGSRRQLRRCEVPWRAADATEEAEPLDEVVVTGTRESRELKKNVGIVQDSIVAEDLDRFPDANMADALSHNIGITIWRTPGGEGQYVSIRGLGPAYSIFTRNGRILATDGDSRFD